MEHRRRKEMLQMFQELESLSVQRDLQSDVRKSSSGSQGSLERRLKGSCDSRSGSARPF